MAEVCAGNFLIGGVRSMSVNSTSNNSTVASLLQSINTISTPGGTGLPVTTYSQELQKALQLQLLTQPQNQITNLQNQQSALYSLQSALNNLQNATNTLAASQNWSDVTATSSNTNDYTITVNAGAQPSIYSIDIQNLAQNQIDVGATSSFTATSSTISTGTFIIEVSGTSTTSVTVTIDSSNNTLQGLVNLINEDTYQTDVAAGLINTGSGYELSLSSTQTGLNYAFSITGTAVSQFGFPATATVSATNASMQVDGITVTSQNNSFVNAIPNVTINAIATGTGNVTLSSDSTSIVNNVQTWMNAYNSVIDLIKTDTAYTAPATNGQSATSGPLFNDVVANTLNSSLPSTLMQTFTNTYNSTINSLASVGIVIDPTTGHLEFQPSSGFGIGTNVSLPDGKSTFTNALSNNSQAVQNLFYGLTNTGTLTSATANSGVLGSLTKMLNSYLIGSNGQTAAISSDISSINQQQDNINNYITLLNQQITSQVTNFTTQLNQLNAAMQQSQFQQSQLKSLIGGTSSSSTTTGG